MSARHWSVLLLALTGTLLFAAPAFALSPPVAPAKLVFANGGRILAMDVRGGERHVIFGRKRIPANDGQGASEPVTSPDGSLVAFTFLRRSGAEELLDVWTVGSGGRGAKRILTSTRTMRYGDPAFSPDGRLVVAFFQSAARFTRSGLISVSAEGRDRKNLLNLRQARRPYRAPVAVMEPDVSPGGDRIIYLLNESPAGVVFDEGFENRLMILNRRSRKSREVTAGAYEATWSPNGRRIAYSLQTGDDDLELCWWDLGCRFSASLAVINADGTGRRFLTGSRIDERSPDWSGDNRILFQSARNLDQTGEASEIYSIRPDGKCLTMLTNGSPASLTPAWLGSGNTAPATCGKKPGQVHDEVRTPDPAGIRGNAYWLGRRPGTRLLTGALTNGRESSFSYIDCDRQFRKECDRPLIMWTADVCTLRGRVAMNFSGSGPVSRERGVPIFRETGEETGPFAYVVPGRSVVVMLGPSGRGTSFARKEVRQLQVLGQGPRTGNLPLARFPSFDIRQRKKVLRIYKRTGSVVRTANRVGRGGRYVRANLRFARYFKDGSFRSVNCSAGR